MLDLYCKLKIAALLVWLVLATGGPAWLFWKD